MIVGNAPEFRNLPLPLSADSIFKAVGFYP
jgi:hypothetical protein